MTKTGTVAFSAPEIFTNSEYNEKVDIWSAGTVLYMMLCGKQPFFEEHVAKLVQQITTADIDFSDSIFNEISREALDLLHLLLTKDPNIRPSAEKVLQHRWFTTDIIEP